MDIQFLIYLAFVSLKFKFRAEIEEFDLDEIFPNSRIELATNEKRNAENVLLCIVRSTQIHTDC